MVQRPLYLVGKQAGEEKIMSSLLETIENVRAKIAKHKGKNLCEADTKAALINPVLGALGWHVGNLDEVSMEFKHASSHNPVDYALLINGSPAVLVEAKALGQSLAGGKWADQIMGYAGTSGVRWVVLTNGDEYRIFNALVEVPFNQKLFREVRITDPNSPAESILALLSRERIDDIGIQWQIHFADRQVYTAIEKLFLPAFTKTLAHFVKKHVRGLTPKEIHAGLARMRDPFLRFIKVFPMEPSMSPPPIGKTKKQDGVLEEPGTVSVNNASDGTKPPAKKPSLLDAAAKVLRESRKPMTVGEILAAVLEKKLWKPGAGLSPDQTLSSAIRREIAKKGKESRFAKTEERGKFTCQ